MSYSLHAQLTQEENYIQSKTYLDYNGTVASKISETVQYFDGLGRPKQVVNVKASPLEKDVVTHIEYDQFGRQVKDYLPFPQSGTQNGAIYTSPLGNASSVYGGEKIYSEKVLENSPLDRIQQQIQVGNDWTGKPVKFDYDANIAGEVYNFVTSTTFQNGATLSTVKVSENNSVSSDGYYNANTLYKSTVTDEDGNKTIEFKNGQGQTLLVRKNGAIQNVDTYYVYNEYNQLAFVISPKAMGLLIDNGLADSEFVLDPILSDLCYQYRYDGRGRLVEKKLPGKGWEYMVYDKADRLILTQDANLRNQEQWLFTKYDQFGRIAYTGIMPGTTRTSMQNQIGNQIITETQTSIGFSKSGRIAYYTNTYLSDLTTLLSINYYDTYPRDTRKFPPAKILDQFVINFDAASNGGISTQGLPTASYVKNIEDDKWTMNYIYYDTKGRVIGTHSSNHLGGYTRKESKLDFAGVAQQMITQHKRLDTDTERVITENFEYDAQNRLKKHWHRVDSNPQELLAENTYNELSQLSNKKVGNNLQSIDYAYNIRGWMTKINDPSNLNGKLFGYALKYQNPVYSNVSTGKYNGNISEIDWVSADNGTVKRYNYQFDGLDRLKNGIYSEPNTTIPQNNYYNETLSYDVNGNIQTLKRNRFVQNLGVQLMDNLSYTYTGNRLNTVTDASGNYGGYPIGGNTIKYDANGNMINHLDKGISSIKYNYLNLPNYIKFNRDYVPHDDTIAYKSNTKYLYNAGGIKLRKTYIYGSGRGNLTETIEKTDYLDGFQYDNDVLSFVPTTEGYYDFKKNTYIYNYTDQLGNIRLAYYKDASGNVKIDRTTNYYPFGLEFGAELSTSNSITPNYRYSSQGQEKQRETGWSSYRWRNYDATMARFFNVDPLSEKYAYQSHYNFSENRVVDGRELEGLEWIPLPIYGVGAMPPPPVYAGKEGAGSSIYETAKSNAINNYNGLIRGLGTQINVLAAVGSTGLVIAKKVLKSEGGSKAESKGSDTKEGNNKERLSKIPKPGRGKGTVEKKDRDPKRTLSEKDKKELIEEKDGKCEGCGKEVDSKTSDAHHTKRHADGGETTKENTNILCKDCHKEMHR
ncbi:hypothetical protein CIN01S_20_00660 [Chryseobacterium indologenes NBRC 14944]|nr:DUF6443 domain-containing protein [Chryseobacterium indologenes]GAE66940.1 hypothetical protein CIN01S_20_00660 [Chryseobacterium indologenes NBRC 14944]SUX49679.1 RHS repeat-associated core domain [Chryseobacterium indologenes]